MTTKTKVKATPKETTTELAKKITSLASWIDEAERSFARAKSNGISIEVKLVGAPFYLRDVQPDDFPVDQSDRLEKYYLRIINEQINLAKEQQAALISKLKA